MAANKYRLCFTLESDATFGRGEGVVGLVDREVEHDDSGLPYVRGRVLKGLLVEECKNILFALEQKPSRDMRPWYKSAHRLFGKPGSVEKDQAILHIGNAQLPASLRKAVGQALSSNDKLTETDILESLTEIRRQTAMDPETGAPAKGSLRAMRVVRQGLHFEAELTFKEQPEENDLALLSACVLALRRAGTVRNRGRGRLRASLCDQDQEDQTKSHFDRFQRLVKAEAGTGEGKESS